MGDSKKYLIHQPYYRKGVYYPAESVVSIPADHKPAANWEPADAPAPAAPMAPVEAPQPEIPSPSYSGKKRHSDRDI